MWIPSTYRVFCSPCRTLPLRTLLVSVCPHSVYFVIAAALGEYLTILVGLGAMGYLVGGDFIAQKRVQLFVTLYKDGPKPPSKAR
jgi:hypothetical protein